MPAEIVIAAYRAHPGKEAELLDLVRRHRPVLVSEGLVTDREPVLMRAESDGTVLEIFEWKDGAAHAAHTNSNVMEIWDGMGAVADFVSLGDLAEAGTRFPHFLPLEGGTP